MPPNAGSRSRSEDELAKQPSDALGLGVAGETAELLGQFVELVPVGKLMLKSGGAPHLQVHGKQAAGRVRRYEQFNQPASEGAEERAGIQ